MIPLRTIGGCAAALLLAGCGGGGVDVGVTVGDGGKTGDLTGDGAGGIGNQTAPFLLLDLAAGTAAPKAAIDDLADGAAYRDGGMVFRRVRGLGSDYFVAAFETTQAQWTRIAGTSPWTAVPAAIAGAGAIDPQRPAFNLSADAVRAAIAAFNVRAKVRLGLPSGAQWQHAAAAGTATTFAWGEDADRATLRANAVVRDILDGADGPRAVGRRAPNGFGLFDMGGNVWELAESGAEIRGGSWHDPAAMAASRSMVTASQAGLTDSTAHALVGVRFILIP